MRIPRFMPWRIFACLQIGAVLFCLLRGLAACLLPTGVQAGEPLPGTGNKHPEAGSPGRSRERALLDDAALFQPRILAEARPILERILTSAGRVGEATLPLSAPLPSMHAVLEAHGAPDHVLERGRGHVHVYGHLGLVTGDPGHPDHVTALWLQGRNYALRAAMETGNTFREFEEPDGRRVRVFLIRTREAARWERVREGVWRELGGSLLPGVYHRHWDETETPESIHVTGKDMTRRLYYRNGALYQDIPLRNAAWNGMSRVYYPSGRVERELPLAAGRLHGDVVLYAPDGTVTARIPYREGVRHGMSRTYHPNGATHHAVPFENGVMQGVSRLYSIHGRLIRETPLVEGRPSGVEKEYGMDGTLRRTQMYRDGVPAGEPMRFSRQGKPLPRMSAEDFGEIDSEIASSPAEVRARQRARNVDSSGGEVPESDAARGARGMVLPESTVYGEPARSEEAEAGAGLPRRVWGRVKFWGGD